MVNRRQDDSREPTEASSASTKDSNEAWHTHTIEAAIDRQQANLKDGLTDADAARRLANYGPNALNPALQRSTSPDASRAKTSWNG